MNEDGETTDIEAKGPSQDLPSAIRCMIGDKQLLKMSDKGIELNRENFPDFQPDDFVREFLYALECNFNVRFTEKEKE